MSTIFQPNFDHTRPSLVGSIPTPRPRRSPLQCKCNKCNGRRRGKRPDFGVSPISTQSNVLVAGRHHFEILLGHINKD